MNENDERKWIIGIISDGVKSDYWKILKGAVTEWIEIEHKRLDGYKNSGLKDKTEIEKYNRSVDRIKYLNKFLTINETIVNYHKSFIEKVKEEVKNYIEMGESFMRRILK